MSALIHGSQLLNEASLLLMISNSTLQKAKAKRKISTALSVLKPLLSTIKKEKMEGQYPDLVFLRSLVIATALAFYSIGSLQASKQ